MLKDILVELIVNIVIFTFGVMVGKAKLIKKYIKKVREKKYAKKTGQIKLKLEPEEVIEKIVIKYKETGEFTMKEARYVLQAASELEKKGKENDDPEQKLLVEKIISSIVKANQYFIGK